LDRRRTGQEKRVTAQLRDPARYLIGDPIGVETQMIAFLLLDGFCAAAVEQVPDPEGCRHQYTDENGAQAK
jgi:hypothetical protein